MPFESHKLMKTVPVIRCQFCPFERAGGDEATADVARHEETKHAKELFEKRLEALQIKPAPAVRAAAATATPVDEPVSAVSLPITVDDPLPNEATRETPAAAAVIETTSAADAAGTPGKSDKGEKKSTQPRGAGTKGSTTT